MSFAARLIVKGFKPPPISERFSGGRMTWSTARGRPLSGWFFPCRLARPAIRPPRRSVFWEPP